MGEDAWLARRMNNPANSALVCGQSQPAFYNGARWYNGPCDGGGVHINSGVQNYWFYLLTSGSSGAPEGTVNNITVNGIGATNAARITYYSLDNYIGQNSGYVNARLGALSAAEVIFGPCSNEYKQTLNAWAAVGLGQPYTSVKITGPGTLAHNSGVIQGTMPKTYVASGGIAPYTWAYSGPWSTNSNSIQGMGFYITNFNGSFNKTTITVNGRCENASKIINFYDADLPMHAAVWPNPVSVALSITPNWTDGSTGTVAVTIINDQTGAQVFEQVYADEAPESLDVSGLQAGVYILYLQKGEEIRHAQFEKQ
jgi:hypothetical protein